jgi:hypothetical protein
MNIISNSNPVLKSNPKNYSFSDVVFRFKEYSKELTRQAIIECLETIDNRYFKANFGKLLIEITVLKNVLLLHLLVLLLLKDVIMLHLINHKILKTSSS